MRWHVPVLTLFLVTGCVRPAVDSSRSSATVRVLDPKTGAAAGDVVRQYAAAIERRDFSTAASYWGGRVQASAFAAELNRHGRLHFDVGEPGLVEGAAGSSYVTVPLGVSGTGPRRAAEIILRRVNDVDGSTAAQRRWHIERIDWKTPS